MQSYLKNIHPKQLNSKNFASGKLIIDILLKANFSAFFVGGWVRDLYLNKLSDEVDIVTDARPEDIQKLFSKTIPIGVAFGIIIVEVNNIFFEIASFRKDGPYCDGRRPENITTASVEEDVLRRDFTINGLLFNPESLQVIDYVNGITDINNKIIRTIGDPLIRFEEDKLRMIRCLRFAAVLGFSIEPNTFNAIHSLSHKLISSVSKERIWQELFKIHKNNKLFDALILLFQSSLLKEIFPPTASLNYENFLSIIKPIKLLDKKIPLIICLCLLFTDVSLEKQILLFKSFNISSKDLKLISEVFYLKNNIDTLSSRYDYVCWFAKEKSFSLLKVYITKFLSLEEGTIFKRNIIKTFWSVKSHILNIKQNKNLITGHDLKLMGISPGPKMKQILSLAQQLTVDHNIMIKEELLKILLSHPKWS